MEGIQEIINEYSFYVILVLTAIVYKLGFARRLPLLKSLIVYFALAVGSVLLKILDALGLPMIEALSAAAALLIIVRFRMRPSGEKDQEGGESRETF